MYLSITCLSLQWATVNARVSGHDSVSNLTIQKRAVPTSFIHPGILYTLSEVKEYRANALSGRSKSLGS